jgi:hypothetical protein
MKITKHNVCQKVEDYLKDNRIRYTISNSDPDVVYYELFLGSLESNLQIEYNLADDTDDFVVVQLYTKVDAYGDSIYHNTWDSENEDDLIEEIDTLVRESKKLNLVISKIGNLVDRIREIYVENELDMEKFIELNYDFNS